MLPVLKTRRMLGDQPPEGDPTATPGSENNIIINSEITKQID